MQNTQTSAKHLKSTVLIEDDIFTIHRHDFGHTFYLELIWKPSTADMTLENYRNHVLMYLKSIEEHNPKSYLINTQHFLFTIPIPTQDWLNEDIFPKSVDFGLRNMAIVVGNDFYAQLSIELTMTENPELGFKTHFFDSVEDAQKWILLI